jgi:hypothetical protein
MKSETGTDVLRRLLAEHGGLEGPSRMGNHRRGRRSWRSRIRRHDLKSQCDQDRELAQDRSSLVIVRDIGVLDYVEEPLFNSIEPPRNLLSCPPLNDAALLTEVGTCTCQPL